MPKCVPVRDMKDTAKFAKLVETSTEPITVTRNGYDIFVVMRSDDYQAMQEEVAKARLLLRIAQANAELAANDYEDGKRFTTEVRSQYGL